MKILFCNKYSFGFSGTEAYLFEVMELLRARGHEVALFAMADPKTEPSEFETYLVPHINFKSAQLGKLEQARLAAHAIYSTDSRHRLREAVAQFRPDVAHVRNIYHHLSPSILWELKAQGIPVVYHLNDFKLLCPAYNLTAQGHACECCQGGKFWHVITAGCYAGSPASRAVLAAEAYTHRWLGTYRECVDRFVAPSEFVRQKLIENGWPEEKITVLPHFQREQSADVNVSTVNAPILYFGRLSIEKGVADLLQAMRHIPRLPLQIVGDGPQRADLLKLADDLSLSNVEFVGQVQGESLNQLILRSRFTVFPSRAYETLGKSILESYSWGRAVIASNLGSRREFVRDGKTGILFPPGGISELIAAINRLAGDPAAAATMGEAGRELLRERHNPEMHYEQLQQIYVELAAPSRRRQSLEPGIPEVKPRIAFIGGRGVMSKYSGIETSYEEIGRRMVDLGHEVTVYCRSYFTPRSARHNGMRLVRLPTIRCKSLETLVHTALCTVHASFGNCDVVHYHALGPALFSFLPRLLGKKTVVTVQGLDWQRRQWGRLAAAVLRLGELASARFPNATVVVSRTLQQHYRDRHRLEPVYIPNGTRVRRRTKPSRLKEWGLESGKYILYLGRFSPEKNCDLLIRAYQRIDTPVKLVLAGGAGWSGRYCEDLYWHSSQRIRFLDWLAGDALDELLTHAMLFVLPSDLEGLSLALLDAMGAGICVLASDIAENREALVEAGFTFKKGDAEDLERMLRLLISDRKVRQATAVRGQRRALENYLWNDIARQLSVVYSELVQHSAKKPPSPKLKVAETAPEAAMKRSA